MEELSLKNNIKNFGERLPKKHGWWYRLKLWNDNYLVYDTWNGVVFHYPNGATPSDTNNTYRCVYVFYDNDNIIKNCKVVNSDMFKFWNAHIPSFVNN